MKRLVLVVALVLSGCASHLIVKVDRADRAAYAAVRGFQNLEEANWHTGASWPSPSEHQQIGQKLSSIYDLINRVASGALAADPKSPLPQIIAEELVQLSAAVVDILALSTNAPPATTKRLTVAHQRLDDFQRSVRHP